MGYYSVPEDGGITYVRNTLRMIQIIWCSVTGHNFRCALQSHLLFGIYCYLQLHLDN